MDFVWMLLVGLIVGVVAKLIMPGKDPGGFIITILLGIAGSLVAGFLGRGLGLGGETGFTRFMMSVIGAILLLGMYRLVTRSRVT
jgi:uncharacterized membrane protein YeaQ/YmgE (transglycosylase-associated protein family)